MSRKNLILLSGKKQSGKNTFSKFFIERGYSSFSFAYEIKVQLSYFLRNVLEVDSSKIDLFENKESSLGIYHSIDKYEITNRNTLQWYGEGIKDLLGQHYWIQLLIKKMRTFKLGNVVITDCRLIYEIEEMIKEFESEYNIYSIRLNRNTGLIDNNRTETQLDNYDRFDFFIENNNTLADLKNEFDKIIGVIE